jgi:glycosyltransferase involved in cell wall biosynthesis
MNNLSILVSVVVPIYNIETFVQECITSLINQTYINLEIILVNDGSTDSCGEICNKFASEDKRIKVIHNENGGLINARKAGLKIAKGEYIGYVDGDDWVEPQYIEEFVKQATLIDADIIIAGHKENLAGRTEVLTNHIKCGIYRGETLKTEIFTRMIYNGNFSQFGIFSYVWGKLYRRSVLYENQMNVDENIFIGEDAACLYPTILISKVICILDSAKYHYRQRVDSLIKTPQSTEVLKINTLYSYLKKQFSNSEYYSILMPQLQYFALSLLAVRSEGPIQYYSSLIRLYPFNNVNKGDKIVICGAGTFGQHLYKRLLVNKGYEVVGWVDELYNYYNILGLAIEGFDAIKRIDFDSIIVAFIDETISKEITQKLIKIGVCETKIKSVYLYEKSDPNELLEEYGIK